MILFLGKLVLNDFRFFGQHDRNVVADRVDAAAGSALQAQAIRR
jgi:hypothetical protein